jgi:cell division protein FtsZ
VDEAASRIRQEVDDEANIILGATFEPALEEAVRVSVVATGIGQAANLQIEGMSAQNLTKRALPSRWLHDPRDFQSSEW